MFTTTLPQYSEFTIRISLYKNVENLDEIRSNLAHLPIAIINAATIVSREQLLSAIYRVFLEKKYNRIRTKNLHSECLLALSPTSNIGDAFKKFGITSHSKEIICLQIIDTISGTDLIDFNNIIKGEEVEFIDRNLHQYFDKDLVRKVCINLPPQQFFSLKNLY